MGDPNPKTVAVIPANMPEQPTYANATFIFFGPNAELTISFMRVPPLTDEAIAGVQDTGTIKANVVAAITLPPEVAAGLAKAILARTDVKAQG